jgi:phosphohistidine phosphatase
MTSLYLIRHGIAEERGTYPNDDDRPLTDEGKKKTRQVAKRLQGLGLRFDLMQTSPLVRARQTANIFGDVFDTDPLTSELLAPEGDFEKWLAWFQTWCKQHGSPRASLGLIGHEPDLSAWAELLIWGEAKGTLVLKKAGVMGLAVPEQEAIAANCLLFLLIPPKLLI